MKQLLITTIAAVVMVGCGPSKTEQELLEAVKNGNFRDTKQYVVSGADVNRKYGKTKATLLHHAASTGNKDIAELLIIKGANINAKDTPFGCTPLHVATEGNKEIVELLISKGANLNAKMSRGRTPLDVAIRFEQSEIADLLRKHGAKTGEELKTEGK